MAGINPQSLSTAGFNRERLLFLYKQHAYRQGEFTLASGKVSRHYFNSKALMLLPEGAFLTACAFLERIRGLAVDAIGGAGIGAAPIAGSMAVLAHFDAEFSGVTFFADRGKPKEHGDKKRFEGPEIGPRVVVVEDVATTGGSALNTAKELRERGHEIVKIIALLDRQVGAQERFAREGIPFEAIILVEQLGLDLSD